MGQPDQVLRRYAHSRVIGFVHRTPGARVIDEFGLGKHGDAGRVDIAVAYLDLLGVEIKSEADSLARLEKQAPLYDRVMDRMILVYQHKTQPSVPGHWGLARVWLEGEQTVHEWVRMPEGNPGVDPEARLGMLWLSELKEIWRILCGLKPEKAGRTKGDYVGAILKRATRDQVLQLTLAAVKSRVWDLKRKAACGEAV